MATEKYQFARGEKAELARVAGLSGVHMYQILLGRKLPSAEAAERLERATSVLDWSPKVHRLAWLYPDQYHNPLVNPDSAQEADEAQDDPNSNDPS